MIGSGPRTAADLFFTAQKRVILPMLSTQCPRSPTDAGYTFYMVIVHRSKAGFFRLLSVVSAYALILLGFFSILFLTSPRVFTGSAHSSGVAHADAPSCGACSSCSSCAGAGDGSSCGCWAEGSGDAAGCGGSCGACACGCDGAGDSSGCGTGNGSDTGSSGDSCASGASCDGGGAGGGGGGGGK